MICQNHTQPRLDDGSWKRGSAFLYSLLEYRNTFALLDYPLCLALDRIDECSTPPRISISLSPAKGQTIQGHLSCTSRGYERQNPLMLFAAELADETLWMKSRTRKANWGRGNIRRLCKEFRLHAALIHLLDCKKLSHALESSSDTAIPLIQL